ncbi:CoA pyrophosphatase [Niveibacterium sp. SC-1]|uniref:CoA pyrophosphatase n=1 Tax=Niveibacterium sp. SC-1 TaxID=3135646 RepID=UPI00311F9BAC
MRTIRPEDLRRALSRPLAASHEREPPPGTVLTRAAVLVPVVDRGEGLNVLLTRRAEHLHHHPGQISFPGGRHEEGDASPEATALRETEEEIGIAAALVEVLGRLPEYVTVTGFRITPVVGLLRPPLELRPDAFEVAEIFEVPLDFLADTANHSWHDVIYEGRKGGYWAMPWQGYNIWGATAGMLRMLARGLNTD